MYTITTKSTVIPLLLIFLFSFSIVCAKPLPNPVDEKLYSEIDQMIMIGFRGMTVSDEMFNILKTTNIGGVILFDYDSPTRQYVRNIESPKQTKDLITDLQKNAKTKLFVAIDEEGGRVVRLKQKYGFAEPLPSASIMGSIEDGILGNTIKSKAIELKGLGFNVNFAPVVDVAPSEKTTRGSGSLITRQGRIFSDSAETVIQKAKVITDTYRDYSIITAAKHFPGQGSATGDSHKGVTDVTKTYKAHELTPYEELFKTDSLPGVMVSHVIDFTVDQKYPASLSKKHIKKLRKGMDYDGLIFSDDYDMGAIKQQYGLDTVVIWSINAGVDILIFSNNISQYNPDMVYRVRSAIYKAVKSRKIARSAISKSYNRIIKAKKSYNVL